MRNRRKLVGIIDGKPISPSYRDKVLKQRYLLTRNQTASELFIGSYLLPHASRFGFVLKAQWAFFMADQVAFIADFWLKGSRILLEIDGNSHHSTRSRERDAWRDDLFRQGGYHVVRVSNKAAVERPQEVLEKLILAFDAHYPTDHPIRRKLNAKRRRFFNRYGLPIGIPKEQPENLEGFRWATAGL